MDGQRNSCETVNVSFHCDASGIPRGFLRKDRWIKVFCKKSRTSRKKNRSTFVVEEVSSHHRRHRAPELPNLDELVFNRALSVKKSASIRTALRQTALKNRNYRFQPFYSIRAVADHFHIPPATVSRIYRQLSAEGLLRMVWGSKTLLEPTKKAEKTRARDIGIAVTLFRFISSPDYRQSILTLQREIWNHGLTEHFLFFQDCDEDLLRLCKQRLSSGIDTVIWLSPDISNKQTLLRLRDIGVRVICLGDAKISGIRDCYTISGKRTLGRILREKVLRIQ